MNERIWDFYGQALVGPVGEGDEVLDPVKFAELIVRECLTVINQPNGVGDDDVIRISDDVKRHFGVEE